MHKFVIQMYWIIHHIGKLSYWYKNLTYLWLAANIRTPYLESEFQIGQTECQKSDKNKNVHGGSQTHPSVFYTHRSNQLELSRTWTLTSTLLRWIQPRLQILFNLKNWKIYCIITISLFHKAPTLNLEPTHIMRNHHVKTT